MALEIVTRQAQAEAAQAAAAARADRRLWLTASKLEVVEDGDPRAAFLFAPPGEGISAADLARYHLTVIEGRIILPTGPGPSAA